jgi:hypothetical protein
MWSSTVASSSCVADLLVSHGWANASRVAILTADERIAALKTVLSFNLNGTFHTVVELSARYCGAL